jgi:hypothetical protein
MGRPAAPTADVQVRPEQSPNDLMGRFDGCDPGINSKIE